MSQQQFDPAAKALINAQGKKFTHDEIAAVEAEWPKLIAEARDHMKKGTDPKDPAVRKIAKRWGELLAMFTGGNEAVEKGLAAMYSGHQGALQDMFDDRIPDAQLAAYIRQATR